MLVEPELHMRSTDMHAGPDQKALCCVEPWCDGRWVWPLFPLQERYGHCCLLVEASCSAFSCMKTRERACA